MQKRLVTILILLLTLIFGSEASAWTGLSREEAGSRAPEARASNLQLTDKQTFKKVGLVSGGEEAIKNPALQQMTAKPEAIKKYAELGKIEKVWEDPKFIEEWHAKYRKDLQDLKDSQ